MYCNYENCSDESLLLMYRLGIVLARDVLTVRYFKNRKKYLYSVVPNLTDVLDDWTYNEVFFHSYLQAENSFELGNGRFYAYFKLILSREIMKAIGKQLNEKRLLPMTSLDSVIDENERCTLCDIVPSSSDDSDPKVFFSYCDTLDSLNKLPKKINKLGLNTAKDLVAGYSLEESAKRNKSSKNSAKMALYRFRKWAREIILTRTGEPVDSGLFLDPYMANLN